MIAINRRSNFDSQKSQWLVKEKKMFLIIFQVSFSLKETHIFLIFIIINFSHLKFHESIFTF